jgi:hypothetical protein
MDDITRETGKWWLARIRQQLETNMTVRAIETVNDRLIVAQCNICLLVWERAPDLDDEAADHSLGQFVADHKTCYQAL